MSNPAAKRVSFEELWERLLDVPEEFLGEIVDGEVRLVPRPDPPHLRAAGRLGRLIGSSFDWDAGGPGGWVIFAEPRIRFGDELRIPDLAGWRVERYREPERGPFVDAPDWICEVLSPSTAADDRGAKMPLYARHAVGHLWIVDPLAKTLEVYRREGELWLALVTHGGDVCARIEPFDAVELDLSVLWRVPTAPG